MADNGLPSSYKFAPAPTPTAAPASTPQATAPAAPTGLPSSYRPPAPVAPAPAAPAAPASASTSGQQATSGQGWGIDWSKGGQVTMPQSVQDFGTVAGNEAMAYGIPGLRTQAEAARTRLPPKVATAADVVGGALSPTNLLYAVPYAGPGLAGGLHAGIKSWEQGNPTSTILEDTGVGVGAGYLGTGAAKIAPTVLPRLAKEAVQLGPAAVAEHVAESNFGPSTGAILSAIRAYSMFDKAGEMASEGAKYALNSPVTQQAIKNLTLGGAAALRTGGGPWDQWIPGQ